MNNQITSNIVRFITLVLLQGLVLRYIGADWDEFRYLHIMLFPLFIMLLPLRAPQILVLLLAFVAGLAVDAFYSTPGVHASASVFIAFIRPTVLRILEPRNGYNVNYSPTAARLGLGWFLRYAAVMLGSYLFFYFSVEAFSFVYFLDILLKTIVSFIASMIFVVIFQIVFNPVE